MTRRKASQKQVPLPQDDIDKKLFAVESGKYGDRYIEHLLEQYKIYIAAAEAISDRRLKANEFFLTLNSGLVALLGFVLAKLQIAESSRAVLLSSVAGVTLCYLWYRMIRSYKGLNSGKFRVIHVIERRLPMALYDTEWEILGRGENRAVYWPFSHIELVVPWIFVAIYSVLFVSAMPWHALAQFISSCFAWLS